MRKTFLTLTALAGMLGAGALAPQAQAAPLAPVLHRDAATAAPLAQKADWDDWHRRDRDGWHAREWRERQAREHAWRERERREAWERAHRWHGPEYGYYR